MGRPDRCSVFDIVATPRLEAGVRKISGDNEMCLSKITVIAPLVAHSSR